MKVKPQGEVFELNMCIKILAITYIELWNQFSNRFSNLLGSFEISSDNTKYNATYGIMLQEPTDDLIDWICNDFDYTGKLFCIFQIGQK